MTPQVVIDGLLIGGLYAGVALGLSLAFGVMRLVNLAHGELLMLGPYLVVLLTVTLGMGIDPLLAIVLLAPIVFGLAYPLQRFVLTPLLSRGMEQPLVATFGVSLLLVAVFTEAFGGETRSLAADYATSSLDVLGLQLRVIYLIAFAVGVGMVLAVHLAITRTRQGRALRAAAEDPDTAGAMGIDVQRTYAVAFALAAVTAAVAGVIAGIAFSVTPNSGAGLLIKAFAVVVLGGLGNVGGTLIGGLCLGVAESIGADLAGGEHRDLVVYGLFIAVLTLRPHGLVGRPA